MTCDLEENIALPCRNICKAAGRNSRVMPDGYTLSDIS